MRKELQKAERKVELLRKRAAEVDLVNEDGDDSNDTQTKSGKTSCSATQTFFYFNFYFFSEEMRFCDICEKYILSKNMSRHTKTVHLNLKLFECVYEE